MIYIHKILPLIFSPLFLSILLIIISLIYRKRIYLFASLIVILLFSNPIFSNFLNIYIEKPYVQIKDDDIKSSDFIVVLSGDKKRFSKGIDLLKIKKARKIIFTGGKVPWDNNVTTEGEIYKNLAIKSGINPDNIILTKSVQNTYQEVLAISKLIPQNSSIILVTSAFHMSRAKFLFNKFNFMVNPFPIDFFNKNKIFTAMDLIPSSQALNRSSKVVRELQGRMYYYFIDYLR